MFGPPFAIALAIASLAPQEAAAVMPSWSRGPMPDYPQLALDRGIRAGEAQLNCSVRADGGLEDCNLVFETPGGAGFGAAALAAVRDAKVSERTVAEAGPTGRTQFTIRFRLG